MSETAKVVVKTPTWNGERSTFAAWEIRFLAHATLYGYSEAVGTTEEPDLPVKQTDTIDTSNEAGKRQEAAKKRNLLAMAHLAQAFEKNAQLNMIIRSKDQDWKGGRAWKVMEQLYKKYKPEGIMAKAQLRVELTEISMKENEDPSNLFEKIAEIENRYSQGGYNVPQDEIIALVIEKVPECYQSALEAESRRLGAALTVNDLEECMDERWKIKKMKNGGDMNDDEEVALSGFSGKCFKCGKLGHKASDCKKKNQSQSQQKSKKFDGSCNNCGKYGHKAVDCWLDERNKDKRPKGFCPKSQSLNFCCAALQMWEWNSQITWHCCRIRVCG